MTAVPKTSVLAADAESSVHAQQHDLWAAIARGYSAFGSPFVPCIQDIAILENVVGTFAISRSTCPINAVMLGVTPGLALMNWPSGTMLTGVDNSSEVIGALWPGDIPGVRVAKCAAWNAVPLQRKSCDVVVGDGSLNVCRFPGEVREILRAVRILLADDGLFACRCYVKPASAESIDDVFTALYANQGLSVDEFKMRLYMAVQRSVTEGVEVREAARQLQKYQLGPLKMQEIFGWGSAVTDPFVLWPNSNSVYSFPKLYELRTEISEYFDETALIFPDYRLGHLCPTIVMRPKQNYG